MLVVPRQSQDGMYLFHCAELGVDLDGFHLLFLQLEQSPADLLPWVLYLCEAQMTFLEVVGQPSSAEFAQHIPERVRVVLLGGGVITSSR